MTDLFASRFEAAWKEPTPDSLTALLAEDVVLLQPHLPPIRGKAAAHAEFSRLFAWIPGTHSVVLNSSETEGVVFIEHELRFPVGSRTIRLPAVDRFVLRNGLGAERVVYFDQARLILGVLKHPSLWPGYLRYRFG
jgi:hypothetical protein